MDGNFVLGVDGGGSGTRCVIADLSGKILARGRGGPSNPLTAGADPAAEGILDAVKEASMRCGVEAFEVSIMGIAGTERPSGIEALEKRLTGFDFGRLRIVSDAKVALAGATGLRPGVVVISGTGSIAFGLNEEGETTRAGGWGWRLGDEGSGYDIGHKALIASLKDFDGRGPPTSLTEKVKTALGLGDLSELVDRVYNGDMGSREVAALVHLVREAAGEGDEVATGIMEEAGEELGIAASAVIRRLGLRGRFPVALNYGIVNCRGALRASLERTVKQGSPECEFIELRFPPQVGAALLALQELGVEVEEKLLGRVEASYGALTEGSR
ncbi:ATPase [Candidatus Bathyarchaeota archaeon]|nr:MAG: ATPase [Candidatus Bathyarchaeota archaeon]